MRICIGLKIESKITTETGCTPLVVSKELPIGDVNDQLDIRPAFINLVSEFLLTFIQDAFKEYDTLYTKIAGQTKSQTSATTNNDQVNLNTQLVNNNEVKTNESIKQNDTNNL